MLAPEFRTTEKMDLMKPSKSFISYNYGTLPALRG